MAKDMKNARLPSGVRVQDARCITEDFLEWLMEQYEEQGEDRSARDIERLRDALPDADDLGKTEDELNAELEKMLGQVSDD